jgi:four helix bundle protein
LLILFARFRILRNSNERNLGINLSPHEGTSPMPKNETNRKLSFADQLEQRLIDFAVRIIRLTDRLPKTAAGRHIAGQILRSGTSPAPNYGEARGAESRADFVHKLRVVLKELNETLVWLQIIERSEMIKPALLIDIIQENGDLCKIFSTALKTAREGKSITKSQISNHN